MDQGIVKKLNKEHCPVLNSAEIIGDKWALMILRECYFGFRRFDEFKEHLNISKSVLSVKLKHLVDHDILQKRAYRSEGQRERFEYIFSRKGKDLYKIIIALVEWGNEHITAPNSETLVLKSRLDNQDVKLGLLDESGKEVKARDTVFKVRRL